MTGMVTGTDPASGGTGESAEGACPTTLCAAAVRTMRDLEAVLGSMSAEQYARASATLDASVGQHVRHAVDHVRALADAFEGDAADSEVIRYDRRDRGTTLETNLAVAQAELSSLCERMGGLDPVHLAHPVTIRVMAFGDGTEVELASTVARELAFVTHHMIHHLAMIKTICREIGVACPPGFGRAPSTVRHDGEGGATG